nr:MAG TPA: nucleocapsid protein [Microviridae sp.]
MSLPEGKAIYLIAFSLLLVLYAQTHRPACHPYSLLLFNVNILR